MHIHEHFVHPFLKLSVNHLKQKEQMPLIQVADMTTRGALFPNFCKVPKVLLRKKATHLVQNSFLYTAYKQHCVEKHLQRSNERNVQKEYATFSVILHTVKTTFMYTLPCKPASSIITFRYITNLVDSSTDPSLI